MTQSNWLDSIPGAVTVCDAEGIITYMNPSAEQLFSTQDGRSLVGSNLFDCHPPEAQEIIKGLMRDRRSNTYTVEQKGKKRLIHQTVWQQEGRAAGLVEISFEIPPILANFMRE